MATTTDYFATSTSSKPANIRTRTAPNVNPASPSSPRTPLLGRSISSQFGSPGSFRFEQEDFLIYELGSRHVSAGFAGESRPRCVLVFGPDEARREGDFRQYNADYERKPRVAPSCEQWTAQYELYRTDLRRLDLGLVEDKFERTVRKIHTDFFQLDNKPRKAALVVPSLLPTPILEIALKVLFNHFSQPPSVVLLTSPIMACVGAGLRNGLIVDIGWEEGVVTAVGEYKEVFQRRTVRAGKSLTTAMAGLLREEVKRQMYSSATTGDSSEKPLVDFKSAEDVTLRLAWCRLLGPGKERTTTVKVPWSNRNGDQPLSIPFFRFAEPTEKAFFAIAGEDTSPDDHDQPIPTLMHNVLLALPPDLRALCISRIVLTGGARAIPGLKLRLLQELQDLVEKRGWDPVQRYGSAEPLRKRVLQAQSVQIAHSRQHSQRESESSTGQDGISLSPAKKPIQDSIPHSQRIHDDQFDSITLKSEREASRGRANTVKGVIRGVETLGAWSGASLVASLRVKGTCEVERDEFLRHALRDVNF